MIHYVDIIQRLHGRPGGSRWVLGSQPTKLLDRVNTAVTNFQIIAAPGVATSRTLILGGYLTSESSGHVKIFSAGGNKTIDAGYFQARQQFEIIGGVGDANEAIQMSLTDTVGWTELVLFHVTENNTDAADSWLVDSR